jgi:hypothetical protein
MHRNRAASAGRGLGTASGARGGRPEVGPTLCQGQVHQEGQEGGHSGGRQVFAVLPSPWAALIGCASAFHGA